MSVDVFYDRSDLITRTVGTVKSALLEATVLVVILLLLFLGDVCASVIVALALPMAVLLTFIVMRAIGLTAILMIFVVLYLSLGSVRASLLILTNIPFAAVGG